MANKNASCETCSAVLIRTGYPCNKCGKWVCEQCYKNGQCFLCRRNIVDKYEDKIEEIVKAAITQKYPDKVVHQAYQITGENCILWEVGYLNNDDPDDFCEIANEILEEADAAFIAEAYQGVQRLIDRIRSLETENAHLVSAANHDQAAIANYQDQLSEKEN